MLVDRRLVARSLQKIGLGENLSPTVDQDEVVGQNAIHRCRVIGIDGRLVLPVEPGDDLLDFRGRLPAEGGRESRKRNHEPTECRSISHDISRDPCRDGALPLPGFSPLELPDALADPLRKGRLALPVVVVRHDEPVSLGGHGASRRLAQDPIKHQESIVL